MLWSDPAWVRWQIEHQKTGDPSAYNVWMMRKVSITIKVDVIPAMQAFNRAMITTAEATRRLAAALELQPKMADHARTHNLGS